MSRSFFRLLSSTSICLLTQLSFAANYYVDKNLGDDSNNGLSPNTPWQSVNKVNNTSLDAGDVVLFRDDRVFTGKLDFNGVGLQSAPIVFTSYGNGAENPLLPAVELSGEWIVLDGLTIDANQAAVDAIRIRNCDDITLQNLIVRNGVKDGVDVAGGSRLSIRNVEIYNFLAGSFENQADAHGIALSDMNGIEIDNVNIHHVSGDSIQIDPNRVAGSIANNLSISNSDLWTGPLLSDFNSGWRAGQVPGENALDTKVLKSGYENEARMVINLTNVSAFGWTKGNYISNRAAFNLKEKIDARFNGVTVYDSEIAFRVRGGRGNADITIENALIYDVDIAVRSEDDLENLIVRHMTVGLNVGDPLKVVSSGSAFVGWDWQNIASLNAISELDGDSVVVASEDDFVNLSVNDYRLSANSSLRDAGELAGTNLDIRSIPRDNSPDIGAFEFQAMTSIPRPPILAGN